MRAVPAAVAPCARDQAPGEATAARTEAGLALAAPSRLAASTGGDPFTLAQRSLAEAQTDAGAEALRLAVAAVDETLDKSAYRWINLRELDGGAAGP